MTQGTCSDRDRIRTFGTMTYLHGSLFKRIPLRSDECIEIVARHDGFFQFYHRVPCKEPLSATQKFESKVYISAEIAEAEARQKFGL